MTIFFMLSGFILAYRYGDGKFSAPDYLVARVARIYPVYLVAALTAIPMLFYQIGDDLRFGTLSVVLQCAILAICVVFMLQAWVPMLFGYLNNNASWSLSVEAFFYVVFAGIIERIRVWSSSQLIVLASFAFVFALVPIAAYYAFEPRPTYGLQIFYAMPIFRLSEFVIGVAAYFLLIRNPWLAGSLCWPALVLVAGGTLYLAVVGRLLPLFVGHNWLVIPAVGCALIALTSDGSLGARILGSAPLVWLGKISYCFYSFQFHSLMVSGFVAKQLGLTAGEVLVLSSGLLLALAVLGYYVVEVPARRWLLGAWRQRQRVEARAVCAL